MGGSEDVNKTSTAVDVILETLFFLIGENSNLIKVSKYLIFVINVIVLDT